MNPIHVIFALGIVSLPFIFPIPFDDVNSNKDTVSPASELIDFDVEMVRLVALYDGPDINIVDAEIILTASRNTAVSFEGDVRKEAVSRNSVKFLDDGVIIRYQGLLWLTEPRAVGDEVNILIRHGASQTEVVAEIEDA